MAAVESALGSIVAHRVVKSYPVKMAKQARSQSSGASIRRNVLRDLEVSVTPGEFFGLVGANGAGKTTLIKILNAILMPDSGSVTVNGFDLYKERRLVKSSCTLVKSGGWTGLLYNLPVVENLRIYGRLSGLTEASISVRVKRMLEATGLEDKANELPWYLSAGQRQKACLAMMGMVSTPIVFLDEPTTHLDPVAAMEIRHFIKTVLNGERGQTVFMSTHYLDEAEALCDRVAVLHEGSIVACGTLEELRGLAVTPQFVDVKITFPSSGRDEWLAILRIIDGVESVRIETEDTIARDCVIRVRLLRSCADFIPAFMQLCEEWGVAVIWLRTAQPTLKDVYLDLVGKDLA